ncbi:MAG: hypothetical protein M3P50_05795, partial [Actinomycetota bacterium]|nr:hypothetical protein [Actinomycetota bacterium]
MAKAGDRSTSRSARGRRTTRTNGGSMSNVEPKISPAAVADLVESATALSQDHGELVEQAVREASTYPLDAERARRLYTRILTILRTHDGGGLSDVERARLADEVMREVDEIVGSVHRPAATEADGLPFVEHNGLRPRPVVPVPSFNDKSIPMVEGYVDVEELALWRGNQRLTLHVMEFKERNGGREPDPEELVKLMQGAINLPSLGKSDPFKLKPLADSIARKGVEIPPIVTFDGEPKDGNRRIAASLLVLYGKEYD